MPKDLDIDGLVHEAIEHMREDHFRRVACSVMAKALTGKYNVELPFKSERAFEQFMKSAMIAEGEETPKTVQ